MNESSKRAVVITAIKSELPNYEPGDRLPGVADLCRRFDVSTATAVYAMRTLIGEGLVTSAQGAGGGYFKASPTSRNPVETLEEVATKLTATAAELGDHATTLRRFTAGTLAGDKPLLEALGDSLSLPLTHWSVRSSDLPEGSAFIGEGDPTLHLHEVTSVRIDLDSVEVTANVALEEDVLSRDAVAINPDQSGVDLETNAPVAMSRDYFATVITGPAVVRRDGEVRLGKIRDVALRDDE